MRACELPALAILCLAFLGSGCGGSVGPSVKGQVLLDDQPVAGARVSFEGKGGNMAVTDDKGKFFLDGRVFKSVKEGKYIVKITKHVDNKTGTAPSSEDHDQLLAAGMLRNTLPEQYGRNEENPLVAEIKPGANELPPFQLKSK
jgi:hypothetical protein